MLYRCEHIISLPRDSYDTTVNNYLVASPETEVRELEPSFQHRASGKYLVAGNLAIVSANKKEFAGVWTSDQSSDFTDEGYRLMTKQLGLPRDVGKPNRPVHLHLVAGKRISPMKFVATSLFSVGNGSPTGLPASESAIVKREDLRNSMFDLTDTDWLYVNQFSAKDVLSIAKKLLIKRR